MCTFENIYCFFDKVESISFIRAIRGGLVKIIPVIMVGSVALILQSLPMTLYQDFIANFCSGVLLHMFTSVHHATFGLLSIYMTMGIASCYEVKNSDKSVHSYETVITSLICFFILIGVLNDEFDRQLLGVQGMFVAIITSTLASCLYIKIAEKFAFAPKIYTDGADPGFSNAVVMMFPAACVVVLFTVLNYLIMTIFHVSGFHHLFSKGAEWLFLPLGRSMLSGLLFVFLSSLLWFFGIHGSDMLNGVTEKVFIPGGLMNVQQIAAGQEPTEILTKQFFDIFVLLGGCGTSMCLLLAILLFSERRSNRSLGKISFLPMLFNINEIMVFGLPIIFNPIFLVPFILTPIVCYFTSYFALSSELVPLIRANVTWITPIFMGGYMATGSFSGIVLQLVNVVIGVMIYCPFVKLYDYEKARNAQKHYQELVRILQDAERSNTKITLLNLKTVHGAIAKALMADYRYALETDQLQLYYQPQYDDQNICFGGEALLRWKHPLLGMIYPPLIIALAQESNTLFDLEKYILRKVVADIQILQQRFTKKWKISINITGMTIQNDAFLDYLVQCSKEKDFPVDCICMEITEQAAIQQSEKINDILLAIKQMGFTLAIDDFSMGHTSMQYLKGSYFDLVKLDGSLVKDMLCNPRCRDIIQSIVVLSKALGFQVLAEYVETQALKEILYQSGCRLYQGYLFSPAVMFEEFMALLSKGEESAICRIDEL